MPRSILAGCSASFCDWYKTHIYSRYADAVGRLFAPLPFAAGEILMYLGILLAVLSLIFAVMLIFLRKKAGYRRFSGAWFRAMLMTVCAFLVLFAATWYIPFRGSVLGQGDRSAMRTEYSYYDLAKLMRFVIETGDAAAEKIETDADGKPVFLTKDALHEETARALQQFSAEYPLLSGYYLPVKDALCSDILERMSIGGYTYPFTAEATRNKYEGPLAVTNAHELCHHKGYFLENEANFLSPAALLYSDEPQLRMTGCWEIYKCVSPEFTAARDEVIDAAVARGDIEPPPKIGKVSWEEVKTYYENATDILGEYRAEFSDRFMEIQYASWSAGDESYAADDHPISDLPALDTFIHNTADLGWSTQKMILKENSYDGDLLLFLQYFDGKLY